MASSVVMFAGATPATIEPATFNSATLGLAPVPQYIWTGPTGRSLNLNDAGVTSSCAKTLAAIISATAERSTFLLIIIEN